MTRPLPSRLPPLRALEAFVAVGRHLNFTKAANELGLTVSAISKRVSALEKDLDLKLWQRAGRSVELTPEGAEYLNEVQPAFDTLRQATATARTRSRAERVVVTLPQSFATLWLMPRLGAFHAAHPDIEVEVHGSGEYADFSADPNMIGIRAGRGHWNGLESELLLKTLAFPVCSPAISETFAPLRHPEDLKNHRLLHIHPLLWMWPAWLNAVGLPGLEGIAEQTFDNVQLLYQAAANGTGIALGTNILAHTYLEKGALIRPFTSVHDLGLGYHLVWPRGRNKQPAIAALISWLHLEAASAQ